MIYIEKGENVPLPRRHHAINNLCAIVYQQLIDLIKLPHYISLLSTSVSLNNEVQSIIDGLESEKLNIVDLLKNKRLNRELTELLTKHITLSILTDFLNYMYESLSCAKRGKMSIAYSLLRKPLTDELLIFEQILHNKEEFIQRFYHDGNPKGYDPSRATDKQKIIENAIAKLGKKYLIATDLIFRIRYDKSFEAGINAISNKALHIVTSDKNYETERQNLNFVFSTNESHDLQWSHYYYFVPYLLMYSAAVIDEILFEFIEGDNIKNLKSLRAFKRFIGIIIWSEKIKATSIKKNNRLIRTLQEILTFECNKCNHFSKLDRADYELFFNTDMLLCHGCRESLLHSTNSLAPIYNLMEVM